MTATRRQMMQPRLDQPQPGPAPWPLHAALDLGALPTAPGCGRTWTSQILREWQLTQLTDSAQLITSELLANASLTGRRLDRPGLRLTLLSDRQQLLILVRDHDPGAPVLRHASEDDESGRGLMLVEAISDQWGWCPLAGGTAGKVVWALLQAPPPGSSDLTVPFMPSAPA
jgi:anti-sigma regulatory factor (Ser/Thr protein kinase)